MRDSEKGGKKPIEAVEKLRTHKAKLERVTRSTTKKEKLQESLQRQKDFYKAVMENTFFGFTLIDRDYKIVLVNSLMCKYFHKPAGELIGKKCFREFEKRQSICPHCPGKKVMETGRPAEVETEKVRDNGSRFLACVQAFPTLDSDGAVTGFIEIAEDITERKKVEQELIQQHNLLRLLIDNLPDRVYVKDCKSRFIIGNDAVVKYEGVQSEKELLGKTDFDLYPKELAASFYAKEQQVIQKGRPMINEEELWTDKQGNEQWLLTTKIPLRDENGKIVGLVGINRDITERKKAEEEIRLSKEKFVKAFSASPAAIFIITLKEGRFKEINESGLKIFGYRREEVVKHTSKELNMWVDYRDREIMIKKLEKEGSVRDLQVSMRRKSGEVFDALISVDTIDIEGEPCLISTATDISERKKAEEALKKSEEKFRNIFENSNVGISVTSLDGTLNANTVFCDMLGYSKEELSRVKWTDITLQEDIALSNNYLGQLRSGKKKSVRFQKRYVKKDGSIIFADASVTLQKDKDGKPPYYITTIMDITERKNMEEALRRNEARYRSSIELTGQLAWTTDSNGEVVEDIPLWRKFTGLSYEETKGSGWTKALHPEDAEHTRQVWGKAVKDKKAYEVEYRLRRFDGVYRDFLTRGIPVFKEDGSIREWVGVNIDITERKKASKALAQSESKFRSLVEHLPQKIFIKDKNSVYLFSNQSYAQDIKIKPEEIIGKTDYDFYSKELAEKYRADDKRIIKTGKIEDIEEKYIEHGKEGWVHTIKTPYKDEKGNIIGVLGIFRDITERKKADQKIYDYQQQLKALSSQLSLIEERAKQKIAAGLHDNVGQKLAVAKLELQSLMRSSTDTKMSDSINSICGEITHIMDDVRSLTFEIGNPLLDEIGLTAALEKYIAEEIQAKFGIECELIDEAGAQDLEEAVRTVLYRSARELLINAVKHAQAHNIKVRIYQSAGLPPRLPPRLLVEDKSGGAAGNIHVCVEDDGVGFKVSEIASLPNKTGGFGLFSIKEQLEYIGGNLQIESMVGHGTKVTIGCPPKLKPALA